MSGVFVFGACLLDLNSNHINYWSGLLDNKYQYIVFNISPFAFHDIEVKVIADRVIVSN